MTDKIIEPEDFDFKIINNEILFDQKVYDAFLSFGINCRSLIDFYSYVQGFPTSVRTAMGWSVDDFNIFKAKFDKMIIGIIPDDILNSSNNSRPPLGARQP